LAGDGGDEFEVGVVVEDGYVELFSCGSNQQVGDFAAPLVALGK
jgi:hypothetical protein